MRTLTRSVKGSAELDAWEPSNPNPVTLLNEPTHSLVALSTTIRRRKLGNQRPTGGWRIILVVNLVGQAVPTTIWKRRQAFRQLVEILSP